MFYLYMITNSVNNNIYIGITKNIKKRWKQHCYKLNSKKHLNYKLYNSMKKYGKENFYISELEQHETIESVLKSEVEVIAMFRKFSPDIVMNLTDGGEGTGGYNMSNEQKKQVSEVHKGKIISKSHRLAIKNSHNLRKDSLEYKLQLEKTAKRMIGNSYTSVKIIDQDGIVYNSIREASDITKCDKSDIGKQTRGERVTPIKNKFIFKKVIS